MKRTMMSIGAAFVALALLAGCSGGQTGDGKTTLQMTWQAGQEKAVDPVVQAFEKANPNITVNVQYLPVDTYGQVVQTRFQSGNGPDIVWGSPGTGNSNAIGLLNQQGKILDLSALPFASSVPTITGLWADKVLYGVPVGVFPVGLAVNMTALKASGTTIPTTFADLLTQCKTAANSGSSFVSIAGQGSGLGSLFLAAMASQSVLGTNPNWVDDRNAGTTTFAATPAWQDTISQFVAMKDAGCYPQGAASIDTGTQISDLAGGKSVTGVVPADALSQALASAPGADFQMVPFPGSSVAATRLPVSFGQGIAINKASKNIPQAETFLEYLQEPATQSLLASGLGAVTLSDYNAGTLPASLSGIQSAVSAKQTVAYIALQFPNPNVLTVLGNDVTGLLTGQTSNDDALTNLDTAWDQK
ncbi:MAG: extracellular solute-binding protein family 1 [Subtercola sp.]|nr:extracellular solute-binding protein family 1 [Subtercola sp.]